MKFSRGNTRKVAIFVLSCVLVAALLAFIWTASQRPIGQDSLDGEGSGKLFRLQEDDTLQIAAIIVLLSAVSLAWILVPKRKKYRITKSL